LRSERPLSAHTIRRRAEVEERIAAPHRALASTPEARLLLAVVLQAVADRGASAHALQRDACAFLEDEGVQDLVELLWGTRTAARVDPRRAAREIARYRIAASRLRGRGR
jgi:hypothetical protein